MAKKRTIHPAASKSRVAPAAHEGDGTVDESAGRHGVHPTSIHGRKEHLPAGAGGLFAGPAAAQAASADAGARRAESFERSGSAGSRWSRSGPRKGPPLSAEPKRGPIEGRGAGPSIRRQCEPLGPSRSGSYHEPAEAPAEGPRPIGPIDEQSTARPSHGGRRMVIWPGRRGAVVNRERARRLVPVVGPGAIHPEPRPGTAGQGHRLHPRPPRGVEVEGGDRVRSTDIARIPMASGPMGPAAAIDRHGRRAIARRPSDTLDGSSRLEMLEEALGSAKPEVFDTERGVRSPASASAFAGRPGSAGVAASMDGRGRASGDALVERPWRGVRREDGCLGCHDPVPEPRRGPGRPFGLDDEEGPHQPLGDRTPGAVDREVGAKRA